MTMVASHTNSLRAEARKSLLDVEDPQRGQFEIHEKRASMYACCPGCGNVLVLPLATPSHPSWSLSGDDERPTLSPSVHHVGCWHGWLRDGQWTSV